jgi:cytoskeletal protein CcmA (bactofilin family)
MAKPFSRDRGVEDFSKVDTVIPPATLYQGVLFLRSSVTVDGFFKGKLESKGTVIIGKKGILEADIVADQVVVHGQVKGKVAAHTNLDIGESGAVWGDVETGQLIVSKGGTLNGFCQTIMDADEDASGHKLEEGPLESAGSMSAMETNRLPGEYILPEDDNETKR